MAGLTGVPFETGATVKAQLHVADGQYALPPPSEYFFYDGTVSAARAGGPSVVLDPEPLVFLGTTVPAANNGPLNNGNLWDIKTYDLAPILVPGEANNVTISAPRYNGSWDCLSLVAILVETPPAGIKILPETTRWKPQRSDQPIEVHFSYPEELSSAVLTVTDPDGTPVLVDPPPVLEPTSTTSPYTYKLVWQGPWTRPDGTGQPVPLPVGNYTVKVEAVRTDYQSTVSSKPYDRVSLVEVSELRFEALPGGPLDDNPAVPALPGQDPNLGRPGGGKRIFAESTTYGGPTYNRVKVVAVTSPVIAPDESLPPSATTVRVHFKSFDVDDPAPYLPDKDGDTTPDAVNDNRGTPGNGALQDAFIDVLAGSTIASTEFEVSLQPGDNYRVAASTSQTWLDTLYARQSADPATPVQDGALNVSGPNVSPMLTVWRTLHLEIDSMEPPPPPTALPGSRGYAERNFIRGTVERLIPEGSTPVELDLAAEATDPPLALYDESLGLPGGKGRFENGRIRVGVDSDAVTVSNLIGSGRRLDPEGEPIGEYVRKVPLELPYLLTTKSGSSGVSGVLWAWYPETSSFYVDQLLPDELFNGGVIRVGGVQWPVLTNNSGNRVITAVNVELPFVLFDDDAATHPYEISQALLLPGSHDPGSNPYAQAYVVPKYDLPGVAKRAGFNRNVDTSADAGRLLSEGRDAPLTSLGFWISYVQGAFQGHHLVDADPWFPRERFQAPN